MPSQAVLELMVALKDQASSGLASIGGSLRSLGTIGLGIAAGGVAAFGAALVSGIGDARDAAQVMAQTESVIRSTGGAAGFTAQQIADMAGSLSAASGQSLFGDDDIQKGQNLLLTFTNIRETLPDATKVMVDMAQAMHTDVSGGAIQLGKALNDPIAGISALSRVGVTFDDKQKQLIETYVKHGQVAKAQQVILAELNKEFGGSAAAAAKADGGWAQFNDRLGEAKEAMGNAVLPLLSRLGGFLNDTIAPAVETAAAAFSAWLSDPGTTATLDSIANTISTGLGTALNFLGTTVLPAVQQGWANLQPTLAVVGAVIQGQILPAIGQLVQWFQGVLPQALAFVNEHMAAFQGALIAIGAVLAGAAILGAIGSLAATIATLASPIGLIVAAVALLGAAWAENWGGIRDTLTAFWEGTARPALADLIAWLQVAVPAAIATLSAFWTGTLQPALAAVWGFIQGSVIPVLSAVWTWLATTIPPAIQTLAAFWTGTLQPALAAVWSFIQDNIIPILSTLVAVSIAVLKAELQALAALWTNVLQPALNAVWAFLNTYVIPILTALANVAIALVKKEVELLAALWTNVLQPALNAVWSFISTNVSPVLESLSNTGLAGVTTASQGLSDFWNNTLKPAFDTITTVVNKTLGPALQWLGDTVLQPIVGFFQDIGRAVQDVIGWLQRLATAINSISIPDWAQGHSPPPLANWFSHIADQVERASVAAGGFALPGRIGAPALTGAARGAGGLAGGTAGGGSTIIIESGAFAMSFNTLPSQINNRQLADQITDLVITKIDQRMRNKK